MREAWKILVIVALFVAVVAVLAGKRNRASTVSVPWSPAPLGSQAHAARPKALPQLIELGSKTCVPCQKMAPILDELRKDYKGQLDVIFYDVYEQTDKATRYGIRVIPTQVFIGSDGKEFFRHEGFFPEEDILATCKEHGIALRAAR